MDRQAGYQADRQAEQHKATMILMSQLGQIRPRAIG